MNRYVSQFELNNDINLYFSNLQFTKVEDKLVSEGPSVGYSIYAAKIHSMLTRVSRYVIVIVPRDYHAIGRTTTISALNWTCLQTRELENSYSIQAQPFQPLKALPIPLEVIDRQEDRAIYKCNQYHIRVEIMNDPRYKSKFQHPSPISLQQAFELYKTIVTKI